MNKWIVISVAVVMTTGSAVSLAIERHARTRAREQKDSLRRHAGQLAQLSEDNQRLSDLVARINSSQSLSPAQLRELLALRNEVGQLRGTTTEKQQLEATNARLHAAVAASEKQLAEAQASPNYWPRDQLTFAGYSDPTSATRSILWAANNVSSSGVDWRTVMTPQARGKLEKEWDNHGLSEAQRTAQMREMAGQMMLQSPAFVSSTRKWFPPAKRLSVFPSTAKAGREDLFCRRSETNGSFTTCSSRDRTSANASRTL